jgi:hypothetical protein
MYPYFVEEGLVDPCKAHVLAASNFTLLVLSDAPLSA